MGALLALHNRSVVEFCGMRKVRVLLRRPQHPEPLAQTTVDEYMQRFLARFRAAARTASCGRVLYELPVVPLGQAIVEMVVADLPALIMLGACSLAILKTVYDSCKGRVFIHYAPLARVGPPVAPPAGASPLHGK